MLKKLSAAALCLCLLFASGCSLKKEAESSLPDTSAVQPSEPEKPAAVYYNPLTGLSGISADKVKTRPVAIMVNNISVAQGVQCGLSAADIIFETEVEGGITRLLAVYQDVSAVDRIGPVRSARYAYIDLAMGLNAVYCHHGQDPTYAKPHLKDTDDFTIDENNSGKRIANGKAKEHTLYTFGSTLWEKLSTNRTVSGGTGKQIFNFASEEQTVSLAGGAANAVTVPFSKQQTTSFEYDAASGKYICKTNGTARKDYVSGAGVSAKNVFVLLTDISDYPDGYHRRVDLNSGSGYYITNGTYTQISWSKGAAKNAFAFTAADGSPLTVSAGNSYICIADRSKSQPSIG